MVRTTAFVTGRVGAYAGGREKQLARPSTYQSMIICQICSDKRRTGSLNVGVGEADGGAI